MSNFIYTGCDELNQTEENLPNVNKNIVNNICKIINQEKESNQILDFGAGIGTLSQILKDRDFGEITCFEIDLKLANECKKRGFHVITKEEELAKYKYDFIFSSNVLEHIEDDDGAVKLIKKVTKEDGKIFVLVPAFRFLWTRMDERVGHIRRYKMQELANLFNRNGFLVESVKYTDFFGVLALLVVKILGYNQSGILGGGKSLKFYNKFIYPFSIKLDFIFSKIIGKNLVLIAKNKITDL